MGFTNNVVGQIIMAQRTLKEFLEREKQFPFNEYVKEPGFESLYVRDSFRFIEGVKISTLEIANVTVMKPGNGTFTSFVKRLETEHNLIVECVTSPRFESLLVNLGFQKLPNTGDGFPTYYKLKVTDETSLHN